jgi:NAD(P)-dependent dehydrogenase (short-subunit alcohol dehydrogenase family)
MRDELRPLRGKTALVTGAARRLGRASALALARAGADVAITFQEVGKRERERRWWICPDLACGRLPCAATSPMRPACAPMMKEAGRELGRIDILVNNAANYEDVPFEKLTVKQWDAIFASNARGPFLVSREALKWMRRKRGRNAGPIEAKIINMGSLGGLRPWPTHAHYCASKAALHMLTKAMAKALAPEIAVNAVAPGVIDLGEESRSFMRHMAAETPMRRNGSGEDVAEAVLFFATAPQFITGQILVVDGGLGL